MDMSTSSTPLSSQTNNDDGDDLKDYDPWIVEEDENGEVTSTFNPRSKARLAGLGGHKHFGYEMVKLVNASAGRVYIPETKTRVVVRDGEKVIEYMETGEKIELLPCQVLDYHKNALNGPSSPLVIKETPDDSKYTLTVEQTIDMLKQFPDIAARKAIDAYVDYYGEDRSEVLVFIMKHLKEVAVRRKAARAI